MQITSFNQLSNSLQSPPPWNFPQTHFSTGFGIVPNTPKFSLKPRTFTRYRAVEGIDDGPGPSSPVRLPVVVRHSGRVSQYVWDGFSLRLVGVDGAGSSVSFDFDDGFRNLYRACALAVKDFFIPKNVSEHYVFYVKWKLLHRVFSSALQVIATQVSGCWKFELFGDLWIEFSFGENILKTFFYVSAQYLLLISSDLISYELR